MTETFIDSAPQHTSPSMLHDLSLAKLADLNMVTQQVCSQLSEKFSQSGAVIRCDDLPQVHANDDISSVFVHVVNMILSSSLNGSKLLIHIKAAGTTNEGLAQIDICTSSKLSPDWQLQQVSHLEECMGICHRNGGIFSYNTSPKAATLFSVALPPKQNLTTLG